MRKTRPARCSKRWSPRVTPAVKRAVVSTGTDVARGPLSPQLTEINTTSLDCCAKRCNVTRPHHWVWRTCRRSREMAKLKFDPVTYQFYYQCPPQEGAPAKSCGVWVGSNPTPVLYRRSQHSREFRGLR